MSKDRVLNKGEKVLRNVFLFPVWLLFKAVKVSFFILGCVAGCGIVRTALTIALGLVILYGIISGLWDGALILGIPLVFLYVLPYICDYVMDGCDFITEKISDYWHTPADYGYYDPE